MKRMLSLCAAALCLTLTLTPTALAADFEPAAPNAKVCYPTAIVRGDDGTELKKIYDLSPEDDPAGIPRSDFRQDGFHYTLTDLLKQELPENESRQHTEHVSVESAKKDMESVLALLPQEREFITDDGLMGTLTLRLDTVQVEPSGYGSSTKEISTKRSYPNLAEQDTQYLPKTITENGKTLTLTDIQWQTDNTANMDGYAVADRYAHTHNTVEEAFFQKCVKELNENKKLNVQQGKPIRAINVGCMMPYMGYEPRTLKEILSAHE